MTNNFTNILIIYLYNVYCIKLKYIYILLFIIIFKRYLAVEWGSSVSHVICTVSIILVWNDMESYGTIFSCENEVILGQCDAHNLG